jgi:hypothetical protein
MTNSDSDDNALQRDVVRGPFWSGVNWSADAGAGSIHDDDTAAELGFRGGTVAGDVHMNQFPATLIKVLGDQWFEHGHLSLSFKNATVDRERVQVCVETPAPGADQTRVWMEREDGLLVCAGTAGIGDAERSELRARDLRPCDPAELKILQRVEPGMPLGDLSIAIDPARQFERYDKGLISDPLPLYREPGRWGGVVAAPCTFVEYFWGPQTQLLRPSVGDAVGLFGAIEIGTENGPLLLEHRYRVRSHVICVGQSPKTEYLWFDTTAEKESSGELVATFRMMLRFMKASSAEYPGSTG